MLCSDNLMEHPQFLFRLQFIVIFTKLPHLYIFVVVLYMFLYQNGYKTLEIHKKYTFSDINSKLYIIFAPEKV